MALEVYDPEKHHVGLGESGGTLYGLVVEQPYQSQPQRQNAPPEYGSTEDQTGPRILQRWTQDNFGGGAYQQVFGPDPAMFADCDGMLPSFLERCARTVPPLVYFAGASASGRPDLREAVGVHVCNQNIAAVYQDTVHFYDIHDGARTTQSIATTVLWASTYDQADNLIYVVAGSGGGGAWSLRYLRAGTSLTSIANLPAGANSLEPQGIARFAKDFIICMGTTLYFADVNDAKTDATFTRVGKLPGQWRDACGYNGLVYILCTDRQQQTTLVAWDGQQILPVAPFPFNFIGTCIKEYGGRLFVGGSGTEVGPTDEPASHRYAEFYEVMGSSLRPIFSFNDQVRQGEDIPTVINTMNVHEGYLWLGTDKDYLVVYDLTRDSIFNGPRIAENPDGREVGTSHLFSTREKLVAGIYDHDETGSPADGFYRLPSSALEVGGSYDCSLDLSTFAPEPDRLKRYSSLKVHTRFGQCGAAYTTDGTTWNTLTGTVDTQGVDHFHTFDLSGLDPSNAIRLRLTFTRSDAAYTEVYSTVLSFLTLDDGKWSWQFTINGALNAELQDETLMAGDPVALRTQLRSWVRDKTPLTFADLDGLEYEVQITDFFEAQPIIAPVTSDTEPYGRESFYRVTLTEF